MRTVIRTWHATLLLAACLLAAGSGGDMDAAQLPDPPPQQQPPEAPPPPPPSQPDPLASWFQGGFAGKKVVFWGNSTVSQAGYFFDQLKTYTGAGGRLEGLDPSLIFNYGSNGASLAAMLNGQGAYAIAAVIAAHPDLLVIRGPLINDVRLGATSLERATQLLQSALDQIVAGSPGTPILLTTENSLLSVDVGSHGYVQPNEAAQQYTDILRAAVLAMKGKYPGVRIVDTMYLEYGTVSLPQSPLMIDQLHPSEAGQRMEADMIANLIGKPQP